MFGLRKRVAPSTYDKRAKMRKLERGVSAKQDNSILEEAEGEVGRAIQKSLRRRKEFKSRCGEEVHETADAVVREKCHAAIDDEPGDELGDAAGVQQRLLKGVQELTKSLQDLHDILQNCVVLSNRVTDQQKLQKSVVQSSGVAAQQKLPEPDEAENVDVIKMPHFCHVCQNVLRSDGITGFTNSCYDHEGDNNEVTQIHFDHDIMADVDEGPEKQAVDATMVAAEINLAKQRKRNAVHVRDGSAFDLSVCLQVAKLQEDEGGPRYDHLMIDNFEPAQDIIVSHETVLESDFVPNSCSFQQHVDAIDGVPSPPAEPVVGTQPALLKKKTRWGQLPFRIRLDGRRWRTKRPGHYGKCTYFTHIKRKHLLHRQFRNSCAVTKLHHNLLEGSGSDRKTLEDERQENEDTPYEVYSRRSQIMYMPVADPGEEEIEDLFQEMALAVHEGWEKPEARYERPTLANEDCLHQYFLQDDVGWVCEKCGFVGRDIQSIFLLQNDTRSNKQAASLAREDHQVGPEIDEPQPLTIARDPLSTVAFKLHPYYEENLHPHQKEGFQFLTRNLIGETGSQLEPGGCILAHAPGTGKSCLTVSFVQSFLTAFPTGRPMIVAPKIMLRPWQSEFALWNVEDVPIYNLNEIGREAKKRSLQENGCGSAVGDSPQLRERLEAGRMQLMKKWLDSRSVMLVSYNLFAILVLAGLKDENRGSLKQQICQAILDGPELLILDEGHFPRTKRTKISQALMRVRTKRRLLLSGTLFQNNFKELFNLLKLARHNFMSLYPQFAAALKLLDQKKPPSAQYYSFAGKSYSELDLARREKEEQMFMENIGYKLEAFVQGAVNHEEINLVLRKLRTLTSPIVHWYPGQILESLPGLFEFVVYVNLTARQKHLYSLLTCKSSFEEKTRIAEVCIHPALLKYEESLERLLSTPHHDFHDPSEGVKTAFVFNLLRLCQISGEKLLIFSQTLSPLSLLESMLSKLLGWSRGKEILRLDGTMQADERQSMIEQFNQVNSNACMMLASITACKEGISLVGASRVVILDVLYNPSVVRQAVSRAFRIGQKKRVYVYRLVAANTKEEKIFQGAVQKDWLSTVLMDQSFRMSGSCLPAENILQVVGAPQDKILQKMLLTDACNRIHRICRYRSKSSR